MAMKKNIKKRWVNALVSKEYNQGHHTLHNPNTDTYCCLGVLCDLAVKDGVDIEIEKDHGRAKFGNSYNYLPKKVQEWAGLDSDNPVIGGNGGRDSLANRNDKGTSFESIAQLIKDNL